MLLLLLPCTPVSMPARDWCERGLQDGAKQSYDYNTVYNLTDNTFEPFYIQELAFCGGNTLLPDGRAFLVGGVYASCNKRLVAFAKGCFVTLDHDQCWC